MTLFGFRDEFRHRICSAGFLIRALALVLTLSALSESAVAAAKTRVLFIGNSYTAQIEEAVTALIGASPVGDTTELVFIAPGGKSLEFHLGSETTLERISEGNWNYVVLQDQSQMPAVWPKRFEAAAIGLDKVIDAAGAKTVFYQTWGRRDGDKQNLARFPTYDSMQDALSANYVKVAGRCQAILLPIGETWARVRARNAELGGDLYKRDGSHPSAKGAYLAACVFYSTIFKKDPADIEFDSQLSSEEKKVILQAIVPGRGN